MAWINYFFDLTLLINQLDASFMSPKLGKSNKFFHKSAFPLYTNEKSNWDNEKPKTNPRSKFFIKLSKH